MAQRHGSGRMSRPGPPETTDRPRPATEPDDEVKFLECVRAIQDEVRGKTVEGERPEVGVDPLNWSDSSGHGSSFW